MRDRLTLALLLACFVVTSQLSAKDRTIPALVLHAKYVALGYETAAGFVPESSVASYASGHIVAEDRQALDNIREALSKWNRYIVVLNPHDADILIAVRSGRIASANAGVRIHTGSIDPRNPTGSGTAIGPVLGGEVGPPSDYLAVYESQRGEEGIVLWQRTQDSGLAGANPPLLARFETEVESAAKLSKKP